MEHTKYQQLRQYYQTLTDEIQRIDTLVEMALEVRNFEMERAALMAEEIIERSRLAHYELGEGRGLNLKGWCYWQQGNYDAGLEILTQSLHIAHRVGSKSLEARVLNNFGYIYRDMGDLANALNHFEKALAINEERGDEVAQSVNLSSIAYLHYDLGDYENALEYALKCLPIFEKAHDAHRLASINQTLGNIYFKQDLLDEALRYFEENRKQTEPDSIMHVMALSGLGKVCYRKNDFVNARHYLHTALEQGQEEGYVEVQIICHYYIGCLLMDERRYEEARQSLDEALKLSVQYMRRHDEMSVHETLSELYDAMGDIPKAFQHLKAYEHMKEDIFRQTTINKLRNLQVRQQTELAQKEKEVAKRTAELKQQFMANMSHEIRTPMNAIVGMTRLLMGQNPRPDQQRYLSAIRQSADNLLVIINDILDLSKIEAGKIVIEQTGFSLAEVIQGMRNMLMLKAEEKGIDLQTGIDPLIPQRLIGDPTRLNQVLVNLAGNAIKFTEKGYVSVQATLLESKGSRHSIRFDIIDTGIGIAEDYVEKIFESFTQAGTDTARKYGGTGLGLTISRQLVSLMHGTISVRSKLGEGTTFSVVIPFEESFSMPESEKTIQTDAATLERLRHIRILLVEDNEFNRMVAEDSLHELLPEARLDVALNGAEAVEKVSQNPYDVVLMDIQMPVMDGVEATRAIRSSLPEPASQVRIIAMTANVLQEDVQQYFAAGMNAYLSKPFQADELLRQIAAVVQVQSPQQPAAAGSESQALPPLPDQIVDLQFLRQFTSGKGDKMRKYIGMFLENGPRLLQKAEEALAARDLAALKIAAHSLKPQLSYMGVREEVSRILLIEQTAGGAGHADQLGPLLANLKRVCEQAFRELAAADVV